MSDSARRGVLESQGKRGCWAVRFADRTRNIRVIDLKVLPSDAASFEPSQAPLSRKERRQARSSAPQSTRKRHRALPESTTFDDTTEGSAADSDVDSDSDSLVCSEVLNAATALLCRKRAKLTDIVKK